MSTDTMSEDGPLLSFCLSEFQPRGADDSRFHIIQAPYERTVSYGGGTAHGPSAILRAADELEAVYLGTTPGEAGVHVHPPLDFSNDDAPAAMRRIANSVANAISDDHIPVLFGGEHTITYGGFSGAVQAGKNVGLIQLDAHADLRDTYIGGEWSHACVIRRIHEKYTPPIIQLGVRGISPEELRYQRDHDIISFDGPEITRNGIPKSWIPDDFPDEIYLTVDIDALDASLMPATGTPSPGGLFWKDLDQILIDLANSGRKIIAFDVVELAPIDGSHSPNFTAAAVVYACMHATLGSWGELKKFEI